MPPGISGGQLGLQLLFLAARSRARLRFCGGCPAAPTVAGMSEPTIDVVGIGNALVDVISHETPDFIAGQGLVPGSMNLIDEERREALYGAMGVAIEASGGSGANTTVGVASLGQAVAVDCLPADR